MVGHLDGGAEDGQCGVADELVDQTAALGDLGHHDREEPVEQLDHVGRVLGGGELGAADDVDEEHAHHAGLAAQLDVAAGRGGGDVLPDVAAEHVAQVLTVAQAADHLVEAHLELAELGAVVDLDLLVELAALDPLHRVAHGEDRRDDGAGVEPGHQEPEDEHHGADHQDDHREPGGAQVGLQPAQREQ